MSKPPQTTFHTRDWIVMMRMPSKNTSSSSIGTKTVLFIHGKLFKVFVQLDVIFFCPPSLPFLSTSDSVAKLVLFVPSKFEEIFCKHARTNPNALTSAELKEMRKANREPKDYGGWISSFAEWTVLYILCKDKNGLLQKDTIRGVYDGSLFEQMAEKKASAGKKKHTVTSE
ncbi:probable peroxygenase 4 isoform X8 [Camellia sinensis]|uniref:probable peroxygenase 4 isoform X8 n=1 Tax=Camellia sinensis TaxID=4442 RepID=UPI00103671CB|nr:probable peroxygenase 4 isoform X8 [Camellia sinensis]